MCCLFTCCGWVTDLVQRFWTFMMSCCISSAVCCALVTASMSGVALGYNYSLAEYIELKETNVSVYLKRGVFDDDVADEMEWRRSGGGPAPGKPEQTPMPPEDYNMPAPRRRDGGLFDVRTTEPMPTQSIFESDEHHKYEGSLFKLTGKPFTNFGLDAMTKGVSTPAIQVAYPYVTESNPVNNVADLINRRKMYYDKETTKEQPIPSTEPERDPLEQMRIIQQLINNRKNAAKKLLTTPTTLPTVHYYGYPHVAEQMTVAPISPQEAERRMLMKLGEHPNYNPEKWYNPQPPTPDPFNQVTVPVIETPRPKAIIPSVEPPTRRHLYIPTATSQIDAADVSTKLQMNLRKSFRDQDSSEGENEKDLLNTLNEPETKEYEDDDIKGLPVRKRRSIALPDNNINVDNPNTKNNRTISINKLIRSNNNTIFKNNMTENAEKEKVISMFDKIIAVLKHINTLLAFSETAIAEVSRIKETTVSLLASTPTSNADIISGIDTSTDNFIVKLIKSTIMS